MRLPVFLSRRPAEPVDPDLAAFYERLLRETHRDVFRNGGWRLCDRSGWPDNQSVQHILAWCWVKNDERALVVVNFGPERAQARVQVSWAGLGGRVWRLDDVLSGETYEREANETRESGLFVDLGPWQCHLFEMRERR